MVFNADCSSNVRDSMIVVVLIDVDEIAASNADQLQQLFQWAPAAGSRLILIASSKADGLQQHGTALKLVIDPYTESDVVAILDDHFDDSAIVQRAVLELCARHANGDVDRAYKLCIVAADIAMRDCNNTGEVTIDDMKQAIAIEAILRERLKHKLQRH
jgi:Cdc6-like AAA superfamily ATPase